MGHDIYNLILLHKSCFELGGKLLTQWFKGWMKADFTPPLEPIEWFTKGHSPGVHLWAPPPAAALVALKQLLISRQKRPPYVTHIFVCQRLL